MMGIGKHSNRKVKAKRHADTPRQGRNRMVAKLVPAMLLFACAPAVAQINNWSDFQNACNREGMDAVKASGGQGPRCVARASGGAGTAGGGGLTPQQQMGLQIFQGVLDGLISGSTPNPEQERLRREAEQARKMEAQRKEIERLERQAREQDEARDRLLANMRGRDSSSSGQLQFRLSDSPTPAPAVPALLRQATPDGGSPIFDCQEATQQIERLTSLLEKYQTSNAHRIAKEGIQALVQNENAEWQRLSDDRARIVHSLANEELGHALKAVREAQKFTTGFIREHPGDEARAAGKLQIELANLASRILVAQTASARSLTQSEDTMKSAINLRGEVESAGLRLAYKYANRLGGYTAEAGLRLVVVTVADVTLLGFELGAYERREKAYQALDVMTSTERYARQKIDEYEAQLGDVHGGRAVCLADVAASRR